MKSFNIRYYIDSKTNEPHIYNHAVYEYEFEEVLIRPGEDHPGIEGSRIALGQTRSEKYLRIIYIPDPEPNSIFVITHMN